jgi:hypothetical protein
MKHGIAQVPVGAQIAAVVPSTFALQFAFVSHASPSPGMHEPPVQDHPLLHVEAELQALVHMLFEHSPPVQPAAEVQYAPSASFFTVPLLLPELLPVPLLLPPQLVHVLACEVESVSSPPSAGAPHATTEATAANAAAAKRREVVFMVSFSGDGSLRRDAHP